MQQLIEWIEQPGYVSPEEIKAKARELLPVEKAGIVEAFRDGEIFISEAVCEAKKIKFPKEKLLKDLEDANKYLKNTYES